MSNASQQYNKGVDVTLRTLLNKRKRKVNDLCKVLYKKKSRTYECLRNPYLLSMQQLSTIAGFLGVDFCGLVCAIYRGRPVRDENSPKHLDKSLLDLLAGSPESVEEDK